MTALDATRARLFHYQPAESTLAVHHTVVAGDMMEERFTFAGAEGERVPGVLTYAPALGPRPVLLIQHGLNAGKDDWRLDQLRRAWSARGFACVSIDAPHHGERGAGGIELLGLVRDPDAGLRFVQQVVIDLRLLIDALEQRRDVADAARIGYLGISMSTVTGVPFVAVEPRVRAACFALGGG